MVDFFKGFFGFGDDSESQDLIETSVEIVSSTQTETETTPTTTMTTTTTSTTPQSTPAWVKIWRKGFKAQLEKQLYRDDVDSNDVEEYYPDTEAVVGVKGTPDRNEDHKLKPDCSDTHGKPLRRDAAAASNDCANREPETKGDLIAASHASHCSHQVFAPVILSLIALRLLNH